MAEMKKKKKALRIILPAALAAGAVLVGAVLWLSDSPENRVTAAETLEKYMACISEGDYEQMYQMLDENSRRVVSREDFIARNQNIYEGIGLSDIQITVSDTADEENEVEYRTVMETEAGQITFNNYARFTDEQDGWYLQWEDSLIFPDLLSSDKIRVEEMEAARGTIYDRNGQVLAGEGTVSTVGLIPGKMAEDASQDLQTLAGLLGLTVEDIQAELEQSWVQEDTFVPIRKISKSQDTEVFQEGEKSPEYQLEQQLLTVPGVMITDSTDRVYPLREKAGLLVGYIQQVTAEDLEENPDKGYTAQSRIGRTGLEAIYEDRLRGTNGCRIYIEDRNGEEKEVLAWREVQDGEDITVTIDAELQSALYDAFAEDRSCHVAMNPATGEVLALVSTPSYDGNSFVLGLSDAQWNALNEDPGQPMYNRFRASFVPGSSLKPVIGAIGLTTGTLDAEADMGDSGLSWQQDKSWGTYTVTTLEDYDGPGNLENALIYSDNIYFAKAALQIGSETLEEQFGKIGFLEAAPFEFGTTPSQYVNEGNSLSSDEILLADTGYGQGEVLVNPIHLASIYSAFVNDGNMIRPVLEYSGGSAPQYWIEGAFDPEAAETVRNDLIQVVESPEGTGHSVRVDGVTLAAKTGTAEIKDSREDTDGTELGWLGVFRADAEEDNGFLLVSMAEDVRGRGGSGYLTGKLQPVLEDYLQ